MTLSTTATEVTYSANGVLTAFTVTFPFYELEVYTSSAGVETLKTVGTHYSVTGGNGSTGTVTFTAAPANGLSVILRRNTTATQLTDWVEGDAFPADVVERAFDRRAMVDQDLARRLTVAEAAGDATAAAAAAEAAATRAELAAAGLNTVTVATIAEAKAIDVTPVTYTTLLLTDDLRAGVFVWTASGLSTEVAADPLNALYIPPNSDATGASGAWVRTGWTKASMNWWGLSESNTASANDTCINSFINWFNSESRVTVGIKPGIYKCVGPFTIITGSEKSIIGDDRGVFFRKEAANNSGAFFRIGDGSTTTVRLVFKGIDFQCLETGGAVTGYVWDVDGASDVLIEHTRYVQVAGVLRVGKTTRCSRVWLFDARGTFRDKNDHRVFFYERWTGQKLANITIYGDSSLVGTAFNISAITKANPAVVTAVGHTLVAGDRINLSNIGGMTQLDGNGYTVGTVAGNTFQLSGVDSTSYTTYTSGGTVAKLTAMTQPIIDATVKGECDTFECDKVQVWTENGAPNWININVKDGTFVNAWFQDCVGDKCGYGSGAVRINSPATSTATSSSTERWRAKDIRFLACSFDTGGYNPGDRAVFVTQAASTGYSYIRNIEFESCWFTYRLDTPSVETTHTGTDEFADLTIHNVKFGEARGSGTTASVIKIANSHTSITDCSFDYAENAPVSSHTTYALETTKDVTDLVVWGNRIRAPSLLFNEFASATAAAKATHQISGQQNGYYGRIGTQEFSTRQSTTNISASGVISYLSALMIVDVDGGSGGAASDNLDTINGGTNGERLTIMSTSSARDIVVRHAVGNIYLNAGVNATLGANYNSMSFVFRTGIGWCETGRNIT